MYHLGSCDHSNECLFIVCQSGAVLLNFLVRVNIEIYWFQTRIPVNCNINLFNKKNIDIIYRAPSAGIRVLGWQNDNVFWQKVNSKTRCLGTNNSSPYKHIQSRYSFIKPCSEILQQPYHCVLNNCSMNQITISKKHCKPFQVRHDWNIYFFFECTAFQPRFTT